MKPFVIEIGDGRLYFDPDTGWLRLDYRGAGPGMELSREHRISLSKALWYSTKDKP